jgi:putative ABC transport system permease protein
LVIRALQQVRALDPGFDPRNGVMMSIDLGLQGYDQTRGANFQRQIVERVRALPGVSGATLANYVPLSVNYSSTDIYLEGEELKRGANAPSAMYASIDVDYFATMGIPLLAGRDFTVQDKPDSTLAVIVNETFVRRLLPAAKSLDEAVGKRFSSQIGGRKWQIVGIAKDGKYFSIGEAYQPFVYFALRQEYESSTTLLVRATGDSNAVLTAVRNAVQEMDASLPIFDVKTFEEHLGLSLFPARVAAGFLGAFGLVALLLAAIGIYGVTSYGVAQRTREIGIRIALGAARKDVILMIVRHGMVLTGIGIGIGIVGAIALTRLMEAVLYGISATDFVTFTSVSLILAGVVFVAGYLPARRAARVDPMRALRYE